MNQTLDPSTTSPRRSDFGDIELTFKLKKRLPPKPRGHWHWAGVVLTAASILVGLAALAAHYGWI